MPGVKVTSLRGGNPIFSSGLISFRGCCFQLRLEPLKLNAVG